MSLTTLKSALKLGAAAIVTCALVLLNPVAAQAMQADPVTVTMTDDCGFVNISIENTTAADVDYELRYEHGNVSSYTVGAGATKTHKWPADQGKDIIADSVAFATVTHVYDTPEDCSAPNVDFEGYPSCQSGLFLLFGNGGDVAQNGVKIIRDTTLLELIDLPANSIFQRIYEFEAGESLRIEIPTADPTPQYVELLHFIFEAPDACDRRPPVVVTDTCTGINIKTTNTTDGALPLETGLLPGTDSDEEEVEFTIAAGASFDQDITFPNGAMYGVVWNEPFTIMVAAKHTAPTNCAPRGDLPVTGPRVALAAGLGGLLLLTGFALYFVARRSRIRSV